MLFLVCVGKSTGSLLRPGFTPRKPVGRRGGHCGAAGVGYAESCVTLYYNVAGEREREKEGEREREKEQSVLIQPVERSLNITTNRWKSILMIKC